MALMMIKIQPSILNGLNPIHFTINL